MVRRAAANRIGEFTKELETEFVQNDFLRIFKTMSKDDQDSVRVLICGSSLPLFGKLSLEEQESELFPMLKQFSEDKSWRVRHAFANIIIDLLKATDPSLINEMISMFQSLLRDCEGEVRIVAAKQIEGFCNNLPENNRKNLTMQHIIPYLKDLATG
jgi:serine/threonine-protein phosphatase 2A regulatory subunit A